MLNDYNIEERIPPITEPEIKCREELLAATRDIANEFGLEMEPFTVWEENEPERIQGAFLNVSTPSGPWCIGAIVRRNNGELRVWERNNFQGPIRGTTEVNPDKLKGHILEMVEQFTAT